DGWIVSQGWPARGSNRRRQAERRRNAFWRVLDAPPRREPARESAGAHADRGYHLPPRLLAPQYSPRWSEDWTSNFSSAQFRRAVERCVEYIHAGDIFQVNLAQRLLRRADEPSDQLYLRLRRENPAPFAG